MAGIAIRAAGETSVFDHPASFTCHFLKPGQRPWTWPPPDDGSTGS